jgi:hypothetical protein
MTLDDHIIKDSELVANREGGVNQVDSEFYGRLVTEHDRNIFTGKALVARVSSLNGSDSDFELIKWLVDAINPKEWVDARNEDGSTALHAVMFGNSSDEQCQFLIDSFIRVGVDPTVKSKYGTILPSLISHAYPEYLMMCLDLGMDVNESTDIGISALSPVTPAFTTMLEKFAESKNDESIERCVKVARILAETGATYDFGARDHLGNTCYDAIRYFGWSVILESVLNGEAKDIEPRNWHDLKWTCEYRGTGFEVENDVRALRPYVNEDIVLHALMLELRTQRYNKDPNTIIALKERIGSVFSALSNEYKVAIHTHLHDENRSMYGYLYLADLQSYICGRTSTPNRTPRATAESMS